MPRAKAVAQLAYIVPGLRELVDLLRQPRLLLDVGLRRGLKVVITPTRRGNAPSTPKAASATEQRGIHRLIVGKHLPC